MQSSVVLLSAGLDSTVNLYAALRETKVALVLTLNYGQRAASKEIETAQALVSKINSENRLGYKLNHQLVELPFFKDFTSTSLVNHSKNIPVGTEVSIHDFDTSSKTAERVWVPNRNGIFLNIAAAFAEGLKADLIIPGFNLEEAQTFPDNSAAYLKKADEAFEFSTANHIKTRCYTIDMNKTEIIKYGQELGVDFNLVWPCYFDEEQICGQCESCLRFANAKAAAGI
jgi:7-cyano-7-deazaguanine synthase